jgi:hypothetical protein
VKIERLAWLGDEHEITEIQEVEYPSLLISGSYVP